MPGDVYKRQVHTLYPPEIPRKMWPLPVEELFFVGQASAGNLRNLGIETIGELAEADPELLKMCIRDRDHVYLKLIILRWLLGQLADVLNLADDVLVPGYIFFEFQGMP